MHCKGPIWFFLLGNLNTVCDPLGKIHTSQLWSRRIGIWRGGGGKGGKRTKRLLNVTVDGKLTSSKSTHHNKTSGEPSKRTTDTKLPSDLDKARGGALTRQTLRFVDFGQHRISRLGDDGRSKARKKTRSQIDHSLAAGRQVGLVHASKNRLSNFFVCNKLRYRVRNPVYSCQSFSFPSFFFFSLAFFSFGVSFFFLAFLSRPNPRVLYRGPNILLEEDRTKTGVKSTNALIFQNLAESPNQAVGEARGRNEADPGCLEGAEGNGRKELGAGRRDGVDGRAVLAGLFEAEDVDGLLLEELVAAEFEGALDKVPRKRWAEAGQQRTGALVLDDLAECADGAAVVCCRVELDPGLDAVGKRG